MITCTRRLEFDAAHRILNHESKCKFLHGHRYALEASFRFCSESLPADGQLQGSAESLLSCAASQTRALLNKSLVANSLQRDSEQNLAARNLDDLGRVIDFGIIREVLGAWIDEHFDHNTILSVKDKKLGEEIAAKTGQKIYYLGENPTAENIAKHLLHEICPKLFADKNVKCVAIRLYETPNCFVDVR